MALVPYLVLVLGVFIVAVPAAWGEAGDSDSHGDSDSDSHGHHGLSDEVVPYITEEDFTKRPRMLLELGDPFLGTGKLDAGFRIPGGAIWQPRLWVFGTLRTAYQSFDNGVDDRVSEGVVRLDLFFNLQLTGTEKIILGLRPLDTLDRSRPPGVPIAGLTFGRNTDAKSEGDFDANIRTLFFEGDFGSLFPFLDKGGRKNIDWGFSIGRQPLNFQEGILINDTVDAFGLVRNNLHLPGISNLRISLVWGWNELDRGSNPGADTNMFGLFTSADMWTSSWNLDLIYVQEDLELSNFNNLQNGDAFYAGFSIIQRIGHLNTAFRINTSFVDEADTSAVPSGDGTILNDDGTVIMTGREVDDGTLLSAELSWTPTATDNIAYVNLFWAIDRFTQAGRERIVGGPLGAFGILFASPVIGNYGAEISPFLSTDVVGLATGHQRFWDNHRRSLVIELAGRKDMADQGLKGASADDVAVGFQFQQAVGRRFQFQVEGYYRHRFGQTGREDVVGGRTELLIQF